MPASRKSFDPEAFVRGAYAIAERLDFEGWKSCFTDRGTFTDQSIGLTYEGSELDYPVRQYGTAFADMHRELFDLWTVGDDTVIVRLALQGNAHGSSRYSLRHDPCDRKSNGRTVCGHIRVSRRQDQAVRLLSGRLNCLDPTRRDPQSGSRNRALGNASDESRTRSIQ
jgi:hypothetical protein